MSDFKCPDCGKGHSISDMELWEVYDEEGKETELNCLGCDKDLIITSLVDGWSFLAEARE